ncbi:MAG: regulatory protein RecX [Clostridia bacterium]|nr:regulatory protein RecX [Clostridia bacterium]
MKKIEYSDYEENTPRDESVKEVIAAASNILVFADNTEKNLRDKLTRKGFNEEAIDAAVNKMKEAGLINDARLMQSVSEYLADKKLYGRARIKLELQKKGFDKQLIGENFNECVSDVDFKENCLKLMQKKRLVDKIKDSKTARAVTAALARYGYGYAEIKYAYTRLLEENEED